MKERHIWKLVRGAVLLLWLGSVAWAGEVSREDEDPNGEVEIQEAGPARDEQESAIARAKKVAIDNPAVVAWNDLGLMYFRSQRYEEALNAYRKALELDPRHAVAHNLMGNAYLAKGDAQTAIQYYQSAIEADPHYSEAYVNSGIAYYRLRKLDEAIQAYRKATEMDPRLADAFCNLGVAYQEKRDTNNAMWALEQAVAINPRHEIARFNLAVTYFSLRKYSEAIREWEMVKIINPGNGAADQFIERAYLQTEMGLGVSVELGFVWKRELDRLVVAAVQPSSSAAEGKFQKGDILLTMEGEKVSMPQAFDMQIFKFAQGQRLKIRVERAKKKQDLWLNFDPGKGLLPESRLREFGETYLKRERAQWKGEVDLHVQRVEPAKMNISPMEIRLIRRLVCLSNPLDEEAGWILAMNPWTGEVLSRQVLGE